MNDDTRRIEAERAFLRWEADTRDLRGSDANAAHLPYLAGYLAGDANGYARGQAAERRRWRGNFGAIRAYLTAIEFKVRNLDDEIEKLHAAVDEELRQIALLDAQKEKEPTNG